MNQSEAITPSRVRNAWNNIQESKYEVFKHEEKSLVLDDSIVSDMEKGGQNVIVKSKSGAKIDEAESIAE